MTQIHIAEAQFVDPRAGNDKFYRTFVIGSRWVTQYGRNETVGTFSKIVEAASEEAAAAAAAAKFTSKVKKGYIPSRNGSLIFDSTIEAGSLTLLDELVSQLPAPGAVGTSVVAADPIAAVDLGPEVLSDLTHLVDDALSSAGVTPTEKSAPLSSLPLRPMLVAVLPVNDIDAVMNSDNWVTQFKYDGDRVLVEVTDGEIRVLNRQGEMKTRNVGRTQLLPFTALHRGRWVFDGEIVGRTLVLFDLVSAASDAHTWVTDNDPFTVRHDALQIIAGVLGVEEAGQVTAGSVVFAPVASGKEAKAQMLAEIVMESREGLIARQSAGLYEQGRRSLDVLKHKLIKDVDVVVTALHPTKESATVSVYDDLGTLVEVGAVSVLGKGPVCVGEVWVVTFLYVSDPTHPRLVQPRLVRHRTDKGAAQCLLDQFASAGTNRIV
ncbi:YD repeat-containing protein [Rhodococcus sp. OAS809]|uniref:ATP-dependent DNA ligase n=1 Tax=Rhodococcus sp. OAS809 TaxID=2663874 RepID=UPI00178B92E6